MFQRRIRYTVLKFRLLKKFSYTDLEKAEMVRWMPGLVDRKSSNIMDALLVACPAAQVTFVHQWFSQHLKNFNLLEDILETSFLQV